MSDIIVKNEAGGIITIADPRTALNYVKWHCEDGEYSFSPSGGGWRAVVGRRGGTLYPVEGAFDQLLALLPNDDPEAD